MPTVGPIKVTNVLAIYDSDSGGFGGPVDMRGPEIGSVAYSQPGGNLLLNIKIEFGQPNTTYRVFLTCGPAHNMACGFITIGSLTTNAVGAGAAAITIPAPVLQSPPFGPGFRNDHLDLLKNAGDLSKGVLVAGAINYFVCKRQVGAKAAESIPKLMADTQDGDPLGSKANAKSKARAKKR
jgi:hypothetical protein